MKIIVSSEREKEIMKVFIDELYDFGADCVISKDSKLQGITSDFISNGIWETTIEVGKTHPMTQEHDIITGICMVCGKITDGTIDQDNVSYDDYLDSLNPKEWYCETCYNELN